jgi:hypothetical protein
VLALALVSVIAFSKLSTVSSDAKTLGKGSDAEEGRGRPRRDERVADRSAKTGLREALFGGCRGGSFSFCL